MEEKNGRLMFNFFEPNERNEDGDESKEGEKWLDPQLWRTCAGSTVQIPQVNSNVFYFPQGYLEHIGANLDSNSTNSARLPPYILCKVFKIRFMADPETDEVFAKIRLIRVPSNEIDLDKDGGVDNRVVGLTSYAKILTQSDANNGGGFSVPKQCAEAIYPPLDLSGDHPEQILRVKDFHGEVWKFRHIYRGTPKRHLLTTGWSSFVNSKRLVCGDSIVFVKVGNGDIYVGIKRGKSGRSLMSRGRVRVEDVIDASRFAGDGKPFDVVYYPRAGNPELFCVRVSLVKASLEVDWRLGAKFKMAFETDDSKDCSRVSWFVGTISSIEVFDPIRWPRSPWKLLEVKWDEPGQLQHVKRVNPWSIALVSNIPDIDFPPFSPFKKMKLPELADFGTLLPTFKDLLGSCYPFGFLCGNSPARMQGARHDQYGTTLFDVYFDELRQPAGASSSSTGSNAGRDENISCLLTLAVGSLDESENNGSQTGLNQIVDLNQGLDAN